MQTLRSVIDPMGYWLRLRRALGPVFTLRLFPYTGLVCVTDPESTRAVLTDQERFRGGDAADLLEPVIGSGSLILTPPPRHLEQRRRLLPPFHGERVARWEADVRELVRARLPELLGGRPVAVRPWAQELTLGVILRLVFGLRDPERVSAFRTAIDRLAPPRMQALLFGPEWLRRDLGPLTPGRAFTSRKRVMEDLLLGEVRARRAAGGGGDDVLSTLLAAVEDDRALHDELMGLVLAGHETTATALAWTLHLLAHHPDARDALVDDLDAGSDTVLKATIKESMRLRSPVIDAIRVATADTRLGGRPVPEGAFVSALFSVMHLDAELWPEPQAFRPERHLEGEPVPYALTPFGGGVRRCIGAALAQLELEVVLREVLSVAVPEPAGDLERVRLNGVTWVPARGGRIVLRPRSAVLLREGEELRAGALVRPDVPA